MNDISLRIRELIDFKNLNISSFEKKIGVGNNSIGTILNRNSNVSGLILSKILNAFPDVCAEWLITGKGEMLKKNHEKITQLNEPETSYHIENKNTVVAAQQKTIAILEREIEDLRNDKKILHKIIEVKL